jgi:hypothetical protein
VVLLYRLLVSQKDASIQALKEKNEFLETQLRAVKDKQPDVLVAALTERISSFEKELCRLKSDNESSQADIISKEAQLTEAKKVLALYTCPKCEAPMSIHKFELEPYEYNGRDTEIEHEHIEYECGYAIHNGKQVGKCGNVDHEKKSTKGSQ